MFQPLRGHFQVQVKNKKYHKHNYNKQFKNSLEGKNTMNNKMR